MTLTSNKPLLGGVALVVVAFLAWLAFGFFGIQAAFIDEEVDEAAPIFTATDAEQDAMAATEDMLFYADIDGELRGRELPTSVYNELIANQCGCPCRH